MFNFTFLVLWLYFETFDPLTFMWNFYEYNVSVCLMWYHCLFSYFSTLIFPIIWTWAKWKASLSTAIMQYYLWNICIGYSINYNSLFVYFPSFIIWIQCIALDTCLNIFQGSFLIILSLWYVFKYTKSNFLVWVL